MLDGFLRIAAATPDIRVADPHYNARQILAQIESAPADTALLVFPELCVTGYTCGDLFLQPSLLRGAEEALAFLLTETAPLDTVFIVGLPVAMGSVLYNCAAVCQKGRLLGLVPKTNLPAYSEFYEARHFSPGHAVPADVRYAGQSTRIGTDLLFGCEELPAFRFGVEICEDLWVASQPSQRLAAAGALLIANLSASDEGIGKGAYRRQLVTAQSARLCCAYLYADAGEGESTSDLVFSGHNLLAENGVLLAESSRFSTGLIAAETDLERLSYERRRMTTFPQHQPMETVSFSYPLRPLTLTRRFSPLPFVPTDPQEQTARCEEILSIQTAGLARRLDHTRSGAVIGLSGGLDSALALLVTARAYDRLGRDRREIQAVTMPCFGTTGRTLNNSRRLAQAVGASLHEIDISAAVTRHLEDIGHTGELDVTYENAQARERTQVLMDLANRQGALVIGTGDLSELALGWATYNGDHMSMYGVNASVPKTLVRHLVAYEAEKHGGLLQDALLDILDTPVSPELLPPKDGDIAQKTEDIVGPYELHDFFLYYLLRFGYPPQKIYRLACLSFAGQFDPPVIKHWLTTFIRRFFSQQFKRNCLPDGPRVGSVALSPRGDWRMPSDASAALWLQQLDTL